MRVRSALLATCVALGACISHPQPNPTTIEMMQKTGWGGYIVITSLSGDSIRGELLAVEQDKVWVQEAMRGRVWIAVPNIRRAALYKYDSDWGFGLWGVAGMVSTISHGFLLVFTAPIWVISASIAAGAESHAMRIQYPESPLEELRPWARYPQGMPVAAHLPERSSRDQSWLLTKQAQGSARAGACDQVRELDVRVRELDPDLHASTFIRDEAIRRCLGLPSLLVPAGESTPIPLAPPGATPSTTPASPAPPAPLDAGVPATP